MLLNLDQFPLPFPDDWFEEIRADHVIEHLNDPLFLMTELHRICRAGADIRIKVPHFSRGMTHPDHKRGFDLTFPYYFNPKFRAGYRGCQLDLVSERLTWFGQPYMKKNAMPRTLYTLALVAGTAIDIFANLSPMVCSRLWCFWVGGFEEYEMHFRVVKPNVSLDRKH